MLKTFKPQTLLNANFDKSLFNFTKIHFFFLASFTKTFTAQFCYL